MTLKLIEEFHGHLGPYVVLGYKLGSIANLKLGSDPFAKRAVSMTGSTPPVSCMIDGVQLSTGCTMGKGNITVEDRGEPRFIFTSKDGSKSVEIFLKATVKARIEATETKAESEKLAEELFGLAEEELFEVHES